MPRRNKWKSPCDISYLLELMSRIINRRRKLSFVNASRVGCREDVGWPREWVCLIRQGEQSTCVGCVSWRVTALFRWSGTTSQPLCFHRPLQSISRHSCYNIVMNSNCKNLFTILFQRKLSTQAFFPERHFILFRSPTNSSGETNRARIERSLWGWDKLYARSQTTPSV